MANRLEDRIRAYLSGHLEILEHGLTLFRAEYPVGNSAGAGARIDIVAKDRYGHFVIVEIKRSDSAARQALHEIHKYTALFRTVHGLDRTHVRVMVVSTDWHELLVPLSECADLFPCLLEGFSIEADSDGVITTVNRIQFIPKAQGMSLSREQAVYLFGAETERDAALPVLAASVEAAGVKDFFIIALEYEGTRSEVCLRFGLYLVFASPLAGLSAPEFAELKRTVGWDDELDSPEENFLVAINRAFVGISDDIEIGFPEKLTNIRRGWRTSITLRSGRLAVPQSPLTDNELLSLAQAIGGGSAIYLHKLSSPKFDAEWRSLRSDVARVLLGMEDWDAVVAAFLGDVEKADPKATVSVSIYNPTNLLMSLHTITSAQSLSHCPTLEVVVEGDKRAGVQILFGVLTWNGKRVTESPDVLMSRVYGGLQDWLMAVHFHMTFEFEAAALRAHHLVAPVVEFRYSDGAESPPDLVVATGSGLQRRHFAPESHMSLAEFAADNADYLASLKALIESHVSGLRQSDGVDDL